MIKISIDAKSLKQMKRNLGHFQVHLPRVLSTAVNRTAKSVRVEVAQVVGKMINLKLSSMNKGNSKPISKAATLKKTIRQKNKAVPKRAEATIGLWEGYPFPAKYHEAKTYTRKRKGKVKSSGVVYKPDMGGGWTTVLDGFISRNWRGNVYTADETNRRTLRQVKGKKPGDYYIRGGISKVAENKARERLPIEVNRRLRDVILAAQGKIKLRALNQ